MGPIIDNILNLKGFNAENKDENVVTLLINSSYENKAILQEAAEKLNGMYLRDEQDRIVSVSLRATAGSEAISATTRRLPRRQERSSQRHKLDCLFTQGFLTTKATKRLKGKPL